MDGTIPRGLTRADLASMDANLIYALYGAAFGRTPDAACADLKQDGQNVIFTHQSVKITFENNMVSDFTDDLLLV